VCHDLYKEPHIILGTSAAIFETLSVLTIITLKVVPFRGYAPFLALLTFFKRILQIVFCAVFSIACDSALITSSGLPKWQTSS
jgi:hypothetical protein